MRLHLHRQTVQRCISTCHLLWLNVTLRQQLFEFYALSAGTPSVLSLHRLVNWLGQQLRQRPILPTLRRLLTNIGFAFISLLLALATWSFVSEQTNPTRRVQVENIVLRTEDLPAGATLLTPLPATVSALIQTTADVRDTLRSSSFQAVVLLEDLPPGLHHLPVQVNSGAAQVRVLSVDPPRLDIELAPVISRTVPVTIDLPEHQSLSPAYTMISAPVAAPQEVQVVGPAPWVEQVSQVQATISLAKASTSLRELRPLKALNEKGHEVTGVNLQPSQAQVNVAIRRRVDARDVGIRVVTTGTPPPGYWLSGLSVTPAGVTLQGNPDLLAEVGSFVDTLPVDVSEAAGDLNIAIPLDLPPDLQALDSEGNSVRNVKVLVQITARQGDLVVSRPVELVNLKPGVVATVDPPEVELLLSGPLPTLSQIEMNKQLVRVLVDATDSAPDQNADVEPTIMAPDGIKVQMAPSSVSVTYHNQPTAER